MQPEFNKCCCVSQLEADIVPEAVTVTNRLANLRIWCAARACLAHEVSVMDDERARPKVSRQCEPLVLCLYTACRPCTLVCSWSPFW